MILPQWRLWMLVPTFSLCVRAFSGTTEKTLSSETDQQDDLPHTLVRVATPTTTPIFTDAAPLTQKFEDVERREFRDYDLVVAYDAGRSKKDLLWDPLLLRDHPQVIHVRQAVPTVTEPNTADDLMRMVSVPSTRSSYLLQLDDPGCPSTTTNIHHDPGEYHDRQESNEHKNNGRTRRSPVNMGAGGGTYCDNCSLALSLAMKADQYLTLVDLVSYLVSLTSGRQFYLVYDDVMQGVEGVARSFQEALGDTILIPYDADILLLTEALTSSYHVQAMRNVFILCTAAHVAILFEKVRKKVLESPTVQWFVIVDEDLTEELPVLLREGTQVALVWRVTPYKAKLFSSRVDFDDKIQFHQVGWWSVSGAWYIDSHQVKGGLVPDVQQLYSDFQGRQLVVTANDNWPFFKITTLENGTVIPISGIDHSLMNSLGKKLNFTYRMTRPPDGNWGGLQPDKTITGMIGQVARHEAHAAICEITITYMRETVVDFSYPYYLESSTLVSPAPKERNRSFAILAPFRIQVWLSICLVTVLVGVLLYMVTRLLVVYLDEEDSVRYSLQSFSFTTYRNLMIQGNLIESQRWSIRFIFFSWYLFSLYISAIYSGTLTASFAIVSYEKPINSLYDLAQAHRNGYTLGSVRDNNFVDALKSAKNGIYYEVWPLFNHEDPDQSFVADPNEGIKRVMTHKYVFFNAELNSKLQAAQRGQDRFYLARQTFLPQGYGIACSSGSPYKDVFDSILIRMKEAGLLAKWANDEMIKVSKNIAPSVDSGPSPITLQHLQAAFFITALGITVSTIALGIEIMASRWW